MLEQEQGYFTGYKYHFCPNLITESLFFFYSRIILIQDENIRFQDFYYFKKIYFPRRNFPVIKRRIIHILKSSDQVNPVIFRIYRTSRSFQFRDYMIPTYPDYKNVSIYTALIKKNGMPALQNVIASGAKNNLMIRIFLPYLT